MCLYKKSCILGGAGCDGETICEEKTRLEIISKGKCPIVLESGKSLDCDAPLWLRALIPDQISCAPDNNCIFAKYFPEFRSKYCDGKKNSISKDEIMHLAAEIRSRLKKAHSGEQCGLTLAAATG